jgi:periplasmic divalent cation tolerance protein
MYVVIFVTAKDEQEANKIAEGLVQSKLIACANIVGGIKSVFWWEGKVDRAQECLLILKSRKALFSRIVKMVKSLHSYDTPEIIALPIVGGNKDYLKWIAESTHVAG